MAKGQMGVVSVQRKTLTEHTFEVVKGMILDNVLKPGQQLNISSLGKELGVSSSPLREALVRLEAERLLVQKLYCGYLVAEEPSAAYFESLLEYRIVTEGHCARIGAPRNDREIITGLQECLDRMSAINILGQKYEEYKEFIEADADFHEFIVNSSQNPVMLETHRSLNVILTQSRLYRVVESAQARFAEVMAEHTQILQAFEAGDGRRAERAVKSHLEGGKRRLLGFASNES
ncbi:MULTISPECIES: GntR family transcriptional regulator [unclassified Mesorhizobium]|uniref:GntR family transcriptional regulator n=1 Tax=unclassified Mesorhizobium TaxID=325217 RepID=UPI000F75023B|nr:MULTISPECIES: GntR family transcriptional regulator [unclassified Mesorhizobium]AZO32260.1 GntR family transcriptional regulator [Mesorhizobium sp. M1B.F.Ca.ET.045.04.1.1]TIV62140.1 MAG: FCD domain-containing protein [Mesorhizobium sp.]